MALLFYLYIVVNDYSQKVNTANLLPHSCLLFTAYQMNALLF